MLHHFRRRDDQVTAMRGVNQLTHGLRATYRIELQDIRVLLQGAANRRSTFASA